MWSKQILRTPLLPFRFSSICLSSCLSSLGGIDTEFLVEQPCEIDIGYFCFRKTSKSLCKLAGCTARCRYCQNLRRRMQFLEQCMFCKNAFHATDEDGCVEIRSR